MSTTYYALRHPVVRVDRVTPNGELYDLIQLSHRPWVGSLRAEFLHLVADRDEKVAHRSGGSITVYATGPDDQQAISEWGDIVTLGQLRRGEAP